MLEKGSGKVALLVTEAPDARGNMTPIRYANDLAVAGDGSIYFTDSTVIPPAINSQGFYDTMASFILAFFQVSYSNALSCFSAQKDEVLDKPAEISGC